MIEKNVIFTQLSLGDEIVLPQSPYPKEVWIVRDININENSRLTIEKKKEKGWRRNWYMYSEKFSYVHRIANGDWDK